MRRIILVVTVVLLMVAMLVGPASATAGCKEFGQLAASEAQLETGVGEEVSAAAPANDNVNELKGLCG